MLDLFKKKKKANKIKKQTESEGNGNKNLEEKKQKQKKTQKWQNMCMADDRGTDGMDESITHTKKGGGKERTNDWTKDKLAIKRMNELVIVFCRLVNRTGSPQGDQTPSNISNILQLFCNATSK